MFIDPSGLRNVLIVSAQDSNGAQTFLNNAKTYVNDNITKDDTYIAIDFTTNQQYNITKDDNGIVGWDKGVEVDLSSKTLLFTAMKNAFGNNGVDELRFESHGYTPWLTWNDPRSINLTKEDTTWFYPLEDMAFLLQPIAAAYNVKMNENATIVFTGCQIADRGGNGFAQYWANVTGATVWASTVNTSQVTFSAASKNYHYQLTERAIATGVKNGTIVKNANGAFLFKSKPMNYEYGSFGHGSYVPQ